MYRVLAVMPTLSLLGGSVLAHSITGLSTPTIARSDRLVIVGSGFGDAQGNSHVLISGVAAHVTNWTDLRIRAHVAEGTPLGAGDVQVFVAGAGSNVVPLEITPRAPGTGRIRWRLRTDHYYSLTRPAVAPDGTIYITGVAGPLYSVSPQGALNWIMPNAGGNRPATVGADGTVYFVGAGASITAADPSGQILWRYTGPSNAGPMFVGPNVGPDGKIYAVTEEEPSLGTDFGAFALSADGSLAWYTSGGYNFRGAPNGWEIAFADGRLFFATGQGGPLTGNSGVHALDMDSGHEEWLRVGIAKVQTDQSANVYWLGAINNNYIGSYSPLGSQRWVISYNTFFGQPGGFVVSPNGSSFYSTSTLARFAGINADGSVRWALAPGFAISLFGATPDNSAAIAVAYELNPTQLKFQARSATDGAVLWEEPVPFEDGVWMEPDWEGAFSPDGRMFYVMGSGNNYSDDPYCYLYAFDLDAAPGDLNCDGSVNGFDVEPLVLALSDPVGYAGEYPDCDIANGDLNADGSVNGFDVDGFVALLGG